MDRSSKQFVIAMAFAAAAFSGSIAELSRIDQDGMDGSKASAKSGLTVKRGTANGKLAPGNQVTLRADPAPVGAWFAGWTGDVAALADRFSPTTTAMVPFTAATVTATYSSVTTSKSVPENVGGGNVLPPTARPKGYSLSDIAKATAFFITTVLLPMTEARKPSLTCRFRFSTPVATHPTHSPCGRAPCYTCRLPFLVIRRPSPGTSLT